MQSDNPWFFKQVEKLREKNRENEKIGEKEIGKLAEYVERKKKFYEKPGNYKKHFLKAERLLQNLQEEKEDI